jgi:hypothetical protein
MLLLGLGEAFWALLMGIDKRVALKVRAAKISFLLQRETSLEFIEIDF